MKYFKVFILFIILFGFSRFVLASSEADLCGANPAIAAFSSTNIAKTPPDPSTYLYKPLVFSFEYYTGGQGCNNANNPSQTISFEVLFYSALAQTLNPTGGCLTSPNNCLNINYLFNKVIEDSTLSGWGYQGEGNKGAVSQDFYYNKLILLSDLDYNATLASTSSTAVTWDSVKSNSWNIMPENPNSSEITPDNISFPCGFSSTANYFNASVGSWAGANRAHELSYFCYPYENTSTATDAYAQNATQSYINKAFQQTNTVNMMRPMFVFSNVTTYLQPNNIEIGGQKSCDIAQNYDSSTSNPLFWGFPFRGQSCNDTQLENLYFMIIDMVD